MSKEVVKREEKNQLVEMTAQDWGGSQTFTQNDIVIPKILPLQFMSEKVKDKLGDYGDFRDTLNNEKFGDVATPFEVIPFFVHKKWIEYDVVTNKAGAKKREYRGVVNIDYSNDGLPYVDADGMVERDRCVDVYVVIPKQVEEGNSFPYVLSFRRTSLKAGNKIITQILRNERMDKPPCAVTMVISGKSVQNDNGEFIVQDVQVGNSATPEQVRDAFSWYKIVSKGETKLDESDIIGAEEVRTASAATSEKF